MDALQSISPMTWLIIIAAVFICTTVLFNKAIKLFLKFAVLAVIFLFVAYFLIEAGIIPHPAGTK